MATVLEPAPRPLRTLSALTEGGDVRYESLHSGPPVAVSFGRCADRAPSSR